MRARLSSSEPPDDALLAYPRALVQSGRIADAEREYRKVLMGLPAGDQRAAIALELAEALSRFGRHADAIPYLQQAMKECADSSSLLTETVQNLLANCLTLAGRATEGKPLIKLTPDLAQALGDPSLVSLGAMTRALLYEDQLRLEDAEREYQLAAEMALRADNLGRAARAWHRASVCRLQRGRLADCLRISDRALVYAKSGRDLLTLIEIHSIRALIYLMRGEWSRARKEVSDGRAITPYLDQLPGEALWLTTVEWYLVGWLEAPSSWGDIEEEIRTAEFPQDVNEPTRWLALAKLYAWQDRLDQGRMELKQAIQLIPPQPIDPDRIYAWLPGAFNLADMICDVGEADEAIARYQHLVRFSQMIVPHVLPPLVLGRLAWLAGMLDDARKWLLDARSRAVRARMRPFEGLVDYYLGLLHAQQHDHLPAKRYLSQALKVFEELRMRYYRDQVANYLKVLAKPASSGNLTEREREVLSLWACGKSGSEIARVLGIEEATVRTHVRHCYEKIGARNRSEATAWAMRHGLV